MIQDFRYALRTLLKSPGFAVAAIGTLALGIGGNTAIFQLIDAFRLRSLPVPDPQQLVSIQVAGVHSMGISDNDADLTYPLWQQIRQHYQALSGVFAWARSGFVLGSGAGHWQARGLIVSGELFPVLGTQPYRGRLFGEYDDRAGCGTPGAVISYALWQNRFGASNSVIGSKLLLNGHALEILGITPPAFFGLQIGSTFDFAIPFCSLPTLFPGDDSLLRRDYWWVNVMGRRKASWTIARVSGYLGAISPGILDATMPFGYASAVLEGYRKSRLAAYRADNGIKALDEAGEITLWLLMAITGLVLVIACTNIANLMLARASAREREIGIRLAIGASRFRVIRQLISESLIVAVAGALLAIYIAHALSRAILWLVSTENNPIKLDLSLDWRVLAFTAAIAILTCLVFGLAPALRLAHSDTRFVLACGAWGMTASRERFSFQRWLVAAQIAISLVLLTGALLFIRSFTNLLTLNPGFREDNILVCRLGMREQELAPERIQSFQAQMLDEIRAIPGVESAAMTTHPLLNGSSWTLGVNINVQKGSSKFSWVSSQYFSTMGTALLAGRDIDAHDTANSKRILVVNETFVRQFLRGIDPIGQLVRTVAEPNYPATEYEIVGVVKDSKYSSLRDEIPQQAFAPFSQFPAPAPWQLIYIRSAASPVSVAANIKKRIGALYPSVIVEIHAFKAEIQEGLVSERTMAALSGFFGLLAAILVSIGLYGVVSYIVVRRRNEIGIRMALGASRQGVVTMIMRETAFILAFGLIAGLVLALATTRSASALLFGVKAQDPFTFLAAGALLALIAALASLWPARRASRLDPMTALRWE